MLCASKRARSLNCYLIQEIGAWNVMCFRKSQEPKLLSDTRNGAWDVMCFRKSQEPELLSDTRNRSLVCYLLQIEPGA
jgi:hypothetical protein